MNKIIPISSLNSAYQMSGDGCCDSVTTSGLPIRKIRPRKIHCILPSSPWLADSKTNVPLGVLYIAGLLRAQGHDIVVTSMLDKRYEGNIHLPESVMDSDVHMFGFCTPQFGEALELAAYIKDRNPEALLVAGGPHPSYEPKEVKEAGRQDAYHYKGALRQRRDYRAADGRQLFDTVIVMEGEVATLQMLSDWDAGKLQPYYYGDKADAMDLDSIPFPAWDLLPHDHIYNDGKAVMKQSYFPNAAHPDASSAVMSLIGTRGCPYKCTYCFIAGTLVTMADGAQRAIETLSVGDLVLAFDRSTGYTEAQHISSVGLREADDVYELKLEDGTILGVTGDHPFVTPEGWQRAASLSSSSYVRRLRSADRRRTASEEEDLFLGLSHEDCGASPRRNVVGRAYETHGNISAYAGNPDKVERNTQERVCGGSQSSSAEASCVTICACATIDDQAAQATKARHAKAQSQLGAHEAKQSNAASRGCRQAVRVAESRLQRGARRDTYTRSFQRCRTTAIRLFRESWFTVGPLWRQTILDRALSIWQAAQSRYAALVGASCNPLLFAPLAYGGGYGHSTAGLRQSWLGGNQLLGRRDEDEREQEFGACPGDRIPGDWVHVLSVTFVGRGTVYPISVEKHETFFTHGFATHNCSTPWIGQKPRYRSPHNIITEMSQVIDKGVRMFKFQDDTYTLHRTKLRELATAVKSAFSPDDFACRIHTRVNTMDDHVAESLKMMNTKVTCFGIESGSQRVLDANQKGTTVAQNTAALKNAKKHGFYTIGFLVIGMAGETLETIEETKRWLLEVKPYLDSCNVAVGIPYPGSRWWTHPQESGIDIVDYNYDNQWIVGFSARDEILVRPHGASVDDMFAMKSDFFKFMVDHGWAKAEWDEDVRIKAQQKEAIEHGVLAAASQISYVGH